MTGIYYALGALLVVGGVAMFNPWLLLVLAGAALIRAGQVGATR